MLTHGNFSIKAGSAEMDGVSREKNAMTPQKSKRGINKLCMQYDLHLAK